MSSRLGFVVLALSTLVTGGLATNRAAAQQSWADTVFSERAHDFGPVPRGATVRHPFVITNRTNVPIQILNLRVSCGCTSGKASASVVEPGGTAIIEAQMDTRNFVGLKATTLFVTLAAGNETVEIGLGVQSNILSDIVLNPGQLDFGAVVRGQTPELQLTIDRIGNVNWRAVKMVSASKVLGATLQETQRGGDSVSYLLRVSIKPDAVAGPVRDEIVIHTNDPNAPSFPVLVTAAIRGELSATPSVLNLGSVESAGGVRGRYIVRASKPFKIVKIEGEGDGFTVAKTDDNAKPLHLLNVVFDPEKSPLRGDLQRTFRITTDLAGEAPIEVVATLHFPQ
ncbi:MAG: DUF1573 domain-containing protein [Isosphaeraceae bacterium]|nr:DUF1573 domain-containing protein [Isosphaeraceae bacterium]